MTRKLTDDEATKIEALTASLGYRPGVFPLDDGTLAVVRRPAEQEFIRWQNGMTDVMIAASNPRRGRSGPKLNDVQRELVLACMIVPEARPEKLALLGLQPALVPKLTDRCTGLAGEDVEELEGN